MSELCANSFLHNPHTPSDTVLVHILSVVTDAFRQTPGTAAKCVLSWNAAFYFFSHFIDLMCQWALLLCYSQTSYYNQLVATSSNVDALKNAAVCFALGLFLKCGWRVFWCWPERANLHHKNLRQWCNQNWYQHVLVDFYQRNRHTAWQMDVYLLSTM